MTIINNRQEAIQHTHRYEAPDRSSNGRTWTTTLSTHLSNLASAIVSFFKSLCCISNTGPDEESRSQIIRKDIEMLIYVLGVKPHNTLQQILPVAERRLTPHWYNFLKENQQTLQVVLDQMKLELAPESLHQQTKYRNMYYVPFRTDDKFRPLIGTDAPTPINGNREQEHLYKLPGVDGAAPKKAVHKFGPPKVFTLNPLLYDHVDLGPYALAAKSKNMTEQQKLRQTISAKTKQRIAERAKENREVLPIPRTIKIHTLAIHSGRRTR